MASLQPIRTKGRTYWRIVESRRVDGKPRPVPILYIGTADALLEKLLEGGASGPLRIQSFEHGSVAALKAAADRLGLADLIDQQVPGQSRASLSVGQTLVLAALNRACHPCSKRAFRDWAGSTSLARLFPEADLDSLSSQVFWDQMDTLSEEALARIETELVRATLAALGVTLDTLFFDTTNFFTYIDSTNDRTQLPRRGHSKQHRTDLRQVGLGLLVSREGQLPLLSMVYPGNENDVTCFPKALQLLRQRLLALGLPLEQLTIVFDRGNNSHDNFKLVDEGPNGYVAALSPASVADLRDLSTSSYRILSEGMLAGLPVYRTRRVVWGAERTILLFISQELLEAQKRGLNQQLAKRIQELEAWREQLAKPKSGPKDAAKALAKYRGGQYLKDFLQVAFDSEKKGSERLSWSIDEQAKAAIEIHFGKRVLITDRHDWTDASPRQKPHSANSRTMTIWLSGPSSTGLTKKSASMPSSAWLLSCWLEALSIRLASMAGREASPDFWTAWPVSAWPWCSNPPKGALAAPGSSRKPTRKCSTSLPSSSRLQLQFAIHQNKHELIAVPAISPCFHPWFPKLPLASFRRRKPAV
jgi:transposase